MSVHRLDNCRFRKSRSPSGPEFPILGILTAPAAGSAPPTTDRKILDHLPRRPGGRFPAALPTGADGEQRSRSCYPTPPRTDRRTHSRPAARGGRGSAGSGSGRVRPEKQIIATGALLMRDDLSMPGPPRRMSEVPRVSVETLPPRPPTGRVTPRAPTIDDDAPVCCESGTRPERIEIPHKDPKRSTPAGQLDIRHFPPPPTAPHPHRRPEPRSLP